MSQLGEALMLIWVWPPPNLSVLSPQFGWTHVTLLIVVTQSHLIIHNLFEGMIW